MWTNHAHLFFLFTFSITFMPGFFYTLVSNDLEFSPSSGSIYFCVCLIAVSNWRRELIWKKKEKTGRFSFSLVFSSFGEKFFNFIFYNGGNGSQHPPPPEFGTCAAYPIMEISFFLFGCKIPPSRIRGFKTPLTKIKKKEIFFFPLGTNFLSPDKFWFSPKERKKRVFGILWEW
jgi:hypothetical protein